jgi:hypothetical protein
LASRSSHRSWGVGGGPPKQFALPNFDFFVTTAYDILRHRGVPVGIGRS